MYIDVCSPQALPAWRFVWTRRIVTYFIDTCISGETWLELAEVCNSVDIEYGLEFGVVVIDHKDFKAVAPSIRNGLYRSYGRGLAESKGFKPLLPNVTDVQLL